MQLARLLAGHDDNRAAYELQKVVHNRQAEGYGTPRDIQTLQQQLQVTKTISDAEQKDFYRRMVDKFPIDTRS